METRVTDQAAFILRRRDWQNSSLMLDLFTRDHGCIRVIAKGARRNPARAPYQPFEILNVSWSGRQELKTLTAIEAQALPVDERNYLSLLYINELLAAMLPAREANPDVFAAYLDLLQQASVDIDEAMLRRFELELMRRLGYFPDISTAADSDAQIDAAAHYQFVINRGFVACDAGARDSVGGATVLAWCAGNYRDDAVLKLAKSVLRSTIDFNLHGKRLKSREVYQQMKRRR